MKGVVKTVAIARKIVSHSDYVHKLSILLFPFCYLSHPFNYMNPIFKPYYSYTLAAVHSQPYAMLHDDLSPSALASSYATFFGINHAERNSLSRLQTHGSYAMLHAFGFSSLNIQVILMASSFPLPSCTGKPP